MKNRICLLLLFSVAFACKKADTSTTTTGGSAITTDPSKPTLNMDVNDTFWQGSDPYADATIFSGQADSTYALRAGGSNTTNVIVAFDKAKIGRQFLNGNTSFSTGKIIYTFDTGSVVINSYDPVKNIISGTFQGSVKNRSSNQKFILTKGFFSNINVYR